jgi:uncharacterized RDD family membrane protein YckC
MSREITILTPENVELQFELAGLGSRFIALLLDSLYQILLAAIPIILIIAVVSAGINMGIEELFTAFGAWVAAGVILFLFAVKYGYFLFYEVSRGGQTPGKKAVGIKVIRDTSHPIDFRSASLRNLMRAVDELPGVYAVGMLAVFLSPQYRRLGDHVAGTLVVKVRKDDWAKQQAEKAEQVQSSMQQELTPTRTLPDELLPGLSQVTKDDYRAVRHFLDRRRELQPAVARNLAAKMAAPLAEKLGADIQTLGDPILFLESIASEWERR